MTSTLRVNERSKQSYQLLPPLENGDHLTRDEFERRYEAMPWLKKAELIEGRVFVGSPVQHRTHGKPHVLVGAWFANYFAQTPGVDVGDNGTIRLAEDSEPQPDGYMLILPECKGQSKIGDAGYVEGAPELAVEVASSSASYDLHESCGPIAMRASVTRSSIGLRSGTTNTCPSRQRRGSFAARCSQGCG